MGFIVLWTAALTGTSGQYDELKVNTYAFDKHYIVFVQDLYGCPHEAISPAECKIDKGVLNYQEYEKARNAAKKLFNLKD